MTGLWEASFSLNGAAGDLATLLAPERLLPETQTVRRAARTPSLSARGMGGSYRTM